MIDGSIGIAVLSILFIIGVLCRYSYYLGYKAGVKQMDIDNEKF